MGRRPLTLSAPPSSFLFLSAALSLKCLFNQHGTCFKIKRGALVTANGSVSASDALSGIPLSPPPKPTRSKLATFHKQFHRLVTQLDVYWKIADFPRAILVPDLGGEAVAHIIDLNYNWSPVSVYAFIYGTFALKCSGLRVCAFRAEAVRTRPSRVTSICSTPDPSPPVSSVVPELVLL